MAWTYTGDPGSSAKDEIRFILGDIDSTDPQLSDEEINYMLSQNSDVINRTVLGLFDVLLLRYGRIVSESVGSVSIQYNQRYQAWIDMRKLFLQKTNMDGIPYAGGISQGDKATQAGNSDRVTPAFGRRMMENHDNER